MDKDFEMEKTSDAERFAKAEENGIRAVKMNIWGNMSTYRLDEWRGELDELVSSQGVSLEEAAIYAGLNSTGYYKRIPKSRESFIGLGMAFGINLERINEWISRYGGKRKLYIKNVLTDIVWIYLIQVNSKQFKENKGQRINFYAKYDEIASEIERVYSENWDVETEYDATEILQLDFLENLSYGDEKALISFVEVNMPQLRSAYLRPRKMISDYVSLIIETVNKNARFKKRWKVESLRGYLSDAQMNYISGDYTSSAALDRNGNITKGMKSIPQGKKSHISLGLSLGMTLNDINEYLDLLGYRPLDPVSPEEAQLINLLTKWEKDHPLQRALKEGSNLKPADATRAVNEMLGLMEDLRLAYEKEQIRISKGGNVSKAQFKFPYYKG